MRPLQKTSQPTIYIIRHAEKPTPQQRAIDRDGKRSPHSLTARGWQRAGALVHYFADPARGVERPRVLFAANPKAPGANPNAKSRREMETAAPLAEYLGTTADASLGSGQEAELAKAAMAQEGPVLIVWDHKLILDAVRLVVKDQPLPARWPGSRFDLTFVLTPSAAGYQLQQLPQLLLAGDLAETLPLV